MFFKRYRAILDWTLYELFLQQKNRKYKVQAYQTSSHMKFKEQLHNY